MIKLLTGCILLVLLLMVAIPIMMIAAPGVLLIIAVWLLFRWLDKAAATPPDNHDDRPRR